MKFKSIVVNGCKNFLSLYLSVVTNKRHTWLMQMGHSIRSLINCALLSYRDENRDEIREKRNESTCPHLYSVGADGKVVCEKRDTPSK